MLDYLPVRYDNILSERKIRGLDRKERSFSNYEDCRKRHSKVQHIDKTNNEDL